MRNAVFSIVLCGLACSGLGCNKGKSDAVEHEHDHTYKLRRVVSANVVDVYDAGKSKRLVLAYVSKPRSSQHIELRKKGGVLLEDLLQNGKVRYRLYADGNHWKRLWSGSLMCTVFAGDSDVAIELLRKGLVYYAPIDGKCPWAKEYIKAEQKAREDKCGVWSKSSKRPWIPPVRLATQRRMAILDYCQNSSDVPCSHCYAWAFDKDGKIRSNWRKGLSDPTLRRRWSAEVEAVEK